jgi:hypothetical protein
MESPKHLQLRWFELLVAGLFGLVGLIVMVDSLRIGKDWGDDGPQAGYFPFYVACTLIGGAAWVIFQTLRDWRTDGGKAVFTGHDAAANGRLRCGRGLLGHLRGIDAVHHGFHDVARPLQLVAFAGGGGRRQRGAVRVV